MELLEESQRLAALRSYEILDTPREEAFDDLAALARVLCDVPIALVALVDENRQWFKSCIGLDAAETPRSIAFCAHAILTRKPMIVPDALVDARFANNPLVTGPPHLRFYAGVPLVDEEGAALGTLCVLDVHARELDAEKVSGLKVLAREVVTQLRNRRLLLQLERAHKRSTFAAEASRLLGASLDLDETLRAIARLAVPDFADACSISLCEADGSLRRVAEAAVAPPDRDDLRSLRETHMPDAQLAMHAAMDARRALLFPDFHSWLVERLTADHPYVTMIARMGVSCSMVAPIVVSDVVRGALSVAAVGRSGRVFDEHDRLALEDLAQRAGLALENARLFEEAQRANQAKDALLAAVSHDLRTPLAAIQNWMQLLRRHPQDPTLRERAFAVIERSARAQSRLVEDLVDATRIAAGKLLFEPAEIDLGAVVEGALDVLGQTAEAKQIELTTEIDPAARKWVGDEGRLAQVVWNLVNNAIKFSLPGGRVKIALRRVGDETLLTVRDHGRGIDAALLPFVFDRFRQDDAGVGLKLGGLGLGLAITKYIVEAHGGSVAVESAGRDQGALFTVRLPSSR